MMTMRTFRTGITTIVFAMILLYGVTATWGCFSSSPRAVPIYCEDGIKDLLVGEWKGDYSSSQTRRSGSIAFALEKGRDTALGYVLMVQRGTYIHFLPNQYPYIDAIETSPTQLLSIKFVCISGDSVRGVLESYWDPDCNCVLSTTFRGKITGDTIRGTFASHNVKTGFSYGGRWVTIRKSH